MMPLEVMSSRVGNIKELEFGKCGTVFPYVQLVCLMKVAQSKHFGKKSGNTKD
jgi:hypothetical protein